MPKLLNKTLLRNAAAYMASDDEHRHDDQTYMCHAVYAASNDFSPDWAPSESPTVQTFEALLKKHGVSTCGGLVHQELGHHHLGSSLRFDFLNLLAESL